MGVTNLIFLFSCSVILCTNAINECPEENDTFFGAQIIFLYAPYLSEYIKGQIVIYYNHAKYQPGDVIILMENNTATGELSFSRHTPTSGSGILFPSIPTLYQNDSILKTTAQFEGHCAYWERDHTRSKQFCLSTHPQWMYDLRSYIGNRTLKSLLLPGTHQSGSYSQSYPQSLVDASAATQNQNVLEQLIFGARYLDIRPSYVRGVYYSSHRVVLMSKMQKIIDDIKEFLDNTQEIVIVSFKEFPRGFETYEDHVKFSDYLQTEFIGYLFPRTYKLWSTTMNEIWKSNRRLIICYDDPIYVDFSFLWPRVHHVQINIPPGGDLQKLVADAETNYVRPKVTMAAYNMNVSTILINVKTYLTDQEFISLYNHAISAGPNITQWYNQLYQHLANVIVVDYIEATGIVDVAIEWNKRYSSACLGDYY